MVLGCGVTANTPVWDAAQVQRGTGPVLALECVLEFVFSLVVSRELLCRTNFLFFVSNCPLSVVNNPSGVLARFPFCGPCARPKAQAECRWAESGGEKALLGQS